MFIQDYISKPQNHIPLSFACVLNSVRKFSIKFCLIKLLLYICRYGHIAPLA